MPWSRCDPRGVWTLRRSTANLDRRQRPARKKSGPYLWAAGESGRRLFRSPAILVAFSTGAPNLRRRPPKAIAQIANQPHPKARPATTSESQWTPRRTRLHATATAMATATPAMNARIGGPRRRASTSAAAAYRAAAVAEWPLGKDGPSVAATGLNVGRTRSSACLIVVTMAISPTTTVTRNTGIHLFGTRTYSTIATAT